ncbi:MAG: transposase [Spirochaetia bacterium]|nr:transposase [Spirochaetia bacterium]
MQIKSKYSNEKKQQIVEDCLNRKEKDGISIASYAKLNNISKQTLYAWVENSKKNEISKPKNLVKLTLSPNKNINTTNNETLNIKINTTFCSIDIPSSLNEESLIKILTALKGIN